MMEDHGVFIVKVLFVIGVLFAFFVPFMILGVYDCNVLKNETRSMKGSYYVHYFARPHDIKVGDIIVFEHDLYKDKKIIKRVSHTAEMPFTTFGAKVEKEPINQQRYVPKNHVAVIGDHEYSFDSRYERFGFIDFSQIRGKAWKVF